jgi:hypothetical protein
VRWESGPSIWLGAHAKQCLRIALPSILIACTVTNDLVHPTIPVVRLLIPVGLNSTALILRLPETSAIFDLSNFPVLLGVWFSTSRSVDSIGLAFSIFREIFDLLND